MTTVVGSVIATIIIGVLVRTRPRPPRVTALRATKDNVRAPADGRGGRMGTRLRLAVRRVAPLVAIAALAGPFVGIAAVVATSLWPRLRALRDLRRTTSDAVLAYPDFVDLLVLSIKSGYAPRQALGALLDVVPKPIQPAISGVLQRMETGQRFAEAVHGLHLPPPHGLGAIAQPLADSLALADRYGTPLPPVLDRLADEARTQRRRNAEAAARRLPVQLSFPLVGCTLPSFVLLTVVPLMAGTFSSLRGLTP